MVSRAPKKNTSHGNEVLPQDSTHLIQRPCYRQGSPCQDPAGNRTTRRPDHRKETQIEAVWTLLPFIRSDQNCFVGYSEWGEKVMRTEREVGQHQGMDRSGVRNVLFCTVPRNIKSDHAKAQTQQIWKKNLRSYHKAIWFSLSLCKMAVKLVIEDVFNSA